MKRLHKRQIILLHDALIDQIGGEPELRDDGLLESAINAPFQTFGGSYLYPSLEQKAARLGFSLIKNHAFVDGNKRIGILGMLAFLDANGVVLACSDDELIEVACRWPMGACPTGICTRGCWTGCHDATHMGSGCMAASLLLRPATNRRPARALRTWRVSTRSPRSQRWAAPAP